MTKADLIYNVAEKAGVTKKDAENVTKALCEVIVEAVDKGDKVALPGFGTFVLSERAARMGVNPKTKEPVQLKASRNLKFSQSSTVKNQYNG